MYASSTRNPGATTTGRTAAPSAEPASGAARGAARGTGAPEGTEAPRVAHGPPIDTHDCTVTLGRAIENSGEWIVRLVRLLAGKKFLAKTKKRRRKTKPRNR